MKKYIQPAIKVQSVEADELMAASEPGLNNGYSSSDQLAKPNVDFEDEEPSPAPRTSVWTDDEE